MKITRRKKISLILPELAPEDKKFDQFAAGDEVQVNDIVVGLRSTDLSKNYQFDFPGTGMRDSSGNYLFRYFSAGSLSVNYPLFLNSLPGAPVVYGADGSDANVSISVIPKGTGFLYLDEIQWPISDGTVNQAIVTDGNAVLSFAGVVLLSGGTMTGSLILNADPTVALGAATKQYVDNIFPNIMNGAAIDNSDYIIGIDGASSVPVKWTWTQALTFLNTNVQLGSYTQVTGVTSMATKIPSNNIYATAAMVAVATTVNNIATYVDTAGTLGAGYGPANPLTAAIGGTGLLSPTANNILVTNGASAMTLVHLNDGQLLIGSTSGAPIGTTITAGANVTVTNAANSITIAVPGTLVTLSGSSVVNHLPMFSNTTGLVTDSGISTNGMTGNLNQMAFKVASNNGLATGVMVSVGTTVGNIPSYNDTTGTINNGYGTSNPIPATFGGTGVASPTANSILVTNGASAMTPVHLNDGQVLIGSTAGAPAASTLTAGTGIAIVNAANSITIATTSTGGLYFPITAAVTLTSANFSNTGVVTNGNYTVTLPTVTGANANQYIDFIFETTPGQLVTLTYAGAAGINGQTSIAWGQYESCRMIVNAAGTGYIITNKVLRDVQFNVFLDGSVTPPAIVVGVPATNIIPYTQQNDAPGSNFLSSNTGQCFNLSTKIFQPKYPGVYRLQGQVTFQYAGGNQVGNINIQSALSNSGGNIGSSVMTSANGLVTVSFFLDRYYNGTTTAEQFFVFIPSGSGTTPVYYQNSLFTFLMGSRISQYADT